MKVEGAPVRTIASIIRRILAVVIVILLVWLVDLRALGVALGQLSWESIAFLLLLSGTLIYVSAMKWALFLRASGQQVHVGELFRLYLVGYFVNLILPSYLGGDIVRSYELGKRVGQHSALAATVLERYTGLVAMVFLGVVTMWFVPNISLGVRLAVLVVALGLVVGTALALSTTLLNFIERRVPALNRVVKHAQSLQVALRLAASSPHTLARALLFSLLYHTLTVVNTQVAAHAVGWDTASGMALFVVLPLILLIGALPVTPQGLGLQEGAFVYFLHLVGATPAQALGVGVVLRAKSYVLALFGGIIWAKMKMRRVPLSESPNVF